MKNATEDMFKKLATQEEANRNTTKAEFDEMTKLYNDTRDRCEVAEKRENSTWKVKKISNFEMKTYWNGNSK